MNLTQALKAWVIENCGITKDADDNAFQKAVAEALMSGKLTAEKFTELSLDDEDHEANEVKSLLQGFKSSIDELKKSLADPNAGKSEGEGEGEKNTGEGEGEGTKTPSKKATQPSRLKKMVTSIGVDLYEEEGEKDFDIRVKEAAEMYDNTKSNMVYPDVNHKGVSHPLAGQPMRDFESGRQLEAATDLGKAISGAYWKFLAQSARIGSKNTAFRQLPQHDRELLLHAMENEKWGGATNGGDYGDIKDRKLTPNEQKALIDDAASGGLEAAPIVFDDDVIQTPLLNGELFPLVTTKPIPRGRRIEGVVTGTVTASWGGVDDSAVSLFNTASYVTAFDTTIFRWEGAIRIGLDFMSDTPIDFGQHVTSQYGERLLEDLDDVIATGNGTTQPEGVMNKTGATSVAFGGSTSLGNYESLRFGVAKPEHKGNMNRTAVFIGTETSYQRARAIPVGGSDARRLGGMDYSSYKWMERDYKINESLTNAQIAYVILARYRMYRRKGLTVRTSMEGDTLLRNNELLMLAMARYGGQLERGAVCARTTTAPA